MGGRLYRLCCREARGPAHCLEFWVSVVAIIYIYMLSTVMNPVKFPARLCLENQPCLISVCSPDAPLNIGTWGGLISIVEGKMQLWEGK